MDYELLASVVSFEENEETLTFAFSADEGGSAKYLMFQYPLQADEQDRNLELDGLYIERDDQVFGCYHGVKSIRTIDDRIEIELSDTGKRRLQVERMVVIPALWDTPIERGLLRLAELSGGKYEVENLQFTATLKE
ncbi:Imm10 family immunity protein [Massilia phyllosphaerae]|uniref:Imm10 family immunity protein n=1 Tax=Massilia phyllosphaerae TaxID=3106034 RepID=UPI002B1CAC17|nr:Imm10 family immunity protein [Massilia sp. SGZ-792]